MAIKVTDLSGEIARLLREYTAEVIEGTEEAKEKTAKNAVKN
jgi:hypothetical protein